MDASTVLRKTLRFHLDSVEKRNIIKTGEKEAAHAACNSNSWTKKFKQIS